MTNADTMTGHLPHETLAAFADGQISSAERAEVINHLASCDDCRALHDFVSDVQAQGIIQPVVVPGNFGRRALTFGLAAAAVLALVLFLPVTREWIDYQRTGGISGLVAAVESMPKRPVHGRLSGLPYKPPKERFRGSASDEVDEESWPLLEPAARIKERGGDSPRRLRGKGWAELLTEDRDTAIATLTMAVEKTGGDDPVVLNDLAAAYLERAHFNGQQEDAVRALEAAERSLHLAKSPEALWNRAFALKLAGRTADAQRAWQEYLAVDPSSNWAQEARTSYLDE